MKNSLLHKLWSKAVGTEDYDKSQWTELERMIRPGYIASRDAAIDKLLREVLDVRADLQVCELDLVACEEIKDAEIAHLKDENDHLRVRYVERHTQMKAMMAAQSADELRQDNQRLIQARDSAIGQAKRATKMCAELKRQLKLAKPDAMIRPQAALGYNHHSGG